MFAHLRLVCEYVTNIINSVASTLIKSLPPINRLVLGLPTRRCSNATYRLHAQTEMVPGKRSLPGETQLDVGR